VPDEHRQAAPADKGRDDRWDRGSQTRRQVYFCSSEMPTSALIRTSSAGSRSRHARDETSRRSTSEPDRRREVCLRRADTTACARPKP
jgi:hypothetical protein